MIIVEGKGETTESWLEGHRASECQATTSFDVLLSGAVKALGSL